MMRSAEASRRAATNRMRWLSPGDYRNLIKFEIVLKELISIPANLNPVGRIEPGRVIERLRNGLPWRTVPLELDYDQSAIFIDAEEIENTNTGYVALAVD